MVGLWNYAPMQFEDHQIFYICQEEPDGHRTLEEAIRVWNDPAREPDHLGRPEYEHHLVTRDPADRHARRPCPSPRPRAAASR